MGREIKMAKKGEADLKNFFLGFTFVLFASFLMDIALTSVVVGQSITYVINLIPFL